MQLSLCFELMDFPADSEEAMGKLVCQACNCIEEAADNKLEEYRINVIVASSDLIQQLNRDYRNKDEVTDVLSFPLGLGEEVTGEIYVCWPRTLEQADEYGHSWQREFSFLLTHGILHLMGYEHGSEPNLEMRAMEEKILNLMGRGRY